jgi:outer membrane protein
MKKIILSAIAVCAFGFANAQDKDSYGFAKGDMYLGGTISYLSEDNGGVKTTSNTIAPEFGYFLSDNLALTAGLELTSEDNGTTKPKTTVISVGGRYYFLNVGERFKTFTNFGLRSGSTDSGVAGADKTSTLGLGAGIGVNYWITSKWAVDFGLTDVFSYTSSKTGDVKSTEMSLDINNKYNNIFAAAKLGLIYKF